MNQYNHLLNHFVYQSKSILGNNLIGVYLHGSAVMECLNDQKSDIDFLIVIKEDISNRQKREYMDMVVELNQYAPARGIEFSIIKEDVCYPFVYPTPFELHFSIMHLKDYLANPDTYIEKMNGIDRDLAAHVMILYYRGKTLYGKQIKEVFSEVSRKDYFDSIYKDINNAKEEIINQPMYIILNLCRVLAFKKDSLILSKQEGGKWGFENISKKYIHLISDAMIEYQGGDSIKLDEQLAKEYAEYMLNQIMNKE